VNDGQKPIPETAKRAARRIERKYSKKKRGGDDFEWGCVTEVADNGRQMFGVPAAQDLMSAASNMAV
jgi:hypothetical protein